MILGFSMKEYFQDQLRHKQTALRDQALVRAQAHNHLLAMIAHCHAEQVGAGIQLPDLDIYGSCTSTCGILSRI